MGTVVTTLSGPIFNVAQTLIINKWFPVKELAKSLSFLVVMGFIGYIIAFMWAGILFRGLDDNDSAQIIDATEKMLWQ